MRASSSCHRPVPRSRARLGVLLVGLAGACSVLAPTDEELFDAGSGAEGGEDSALAGSGGRSAEGGSAGRVSGDSGAAGAGGSPSAGASAGGDAGSGGASGAPGGQAGAGGAHSTCEACPTGATCRDGTCACPAGTHVCSGRCVSNDAIASCGAACTPCTSPQNGAATCDGKSCGISCNVGFTRCGQQCVDLRTDSKNCGGCGTAFSCGADSACRAGSCVSVSGCSDGTREGFVDVGAFPAIAGCGALWPMGSLRAAKTGAACGRGLASCAAPADACGTGWHVCAAPPHGPTDVSSKVTAAQCLSQPGEFAMAVGDQNCEPCSATADGAACCGDRCVQQNGSCVYPGETAWFGVIAGHKNTCAEIESTGADGGVLCCRDPE